MSRWLSYLLSCRQPCRWSVLCYSAEAGAVSGSADSTCAYLYMFQASPVPTSAPYATADERVLWFSERFRDWNINRGLVASPVRDLSYLCSSDHSEIICLASQHTLLLQAEVMAFGGDGDAEPRPQLVLSNKWWFVRSAETRTVEVCPSGRDVGFNWVTCSCLPVFCRSCAMSDSTYDIMAEPNLWLQTRAIQYLLLLMSAQCH